jgi:HK97 family phage major capsid protein
MNQNPTPSELLNRRAQLRDEKRGIARQLEKLPGNAIMPVGIPDRLDDINAELDTIEVHLERAGSTGVRTAGAGRSQTVRIGQEERTYRPDHQQTGEPSFFRDLALSQVFRDPAATERLARHQHEMTVDGRPGTQQRAIGSSAVVGLVPPQYLAEQYAELARAGRPVADACTKLVLPAEGLTVAISRITTGTSAAIQASEGAGVSETNADDTLLSVPVNTIAGQQTVSRQAVDRGALVETVLMADLAGAHNAALDVQVINGSGASGQHLGMLNTSGINAITYTDASPTIPELWPKEVDAVRQVAAQRFTGATHTIMNSLMWGFHLAAVDTTGRPLFDVGGSNAPTNILATGATQYQDGGVLLGTKLLQSGGVPSNLGGGTNETRIIAVDMRDVFLWEDPNMPIYIKAEETLAANLQVLYVIYSYSAFTAGRQPKAVSAISGTGMIPVAL